jgi:heme-degrading monooxygenase HmoA
MAREAPGCLDFAQSPDPLEPDRINVFERWESDAALQAFRDLPSDGESVPVRRLRVLAWSSSRAEAESVCCA